MSRGPKALQEILVLDVADRSADLMPTQELFQTSLIPRHTWFEPFRDAVGRSLFTNRAATAIGVIVPLLFGMLYTLDNLLWRHLAHWIVLPAVVIYYVLWGLPPLREWLYEGAFTCPWPAKVCLTGVAPYVLVVCVGLIYALQPDQEVRYHVVQQFTRLLAPELLPTDKPLADAGETVTSILSDAPLLNPISLLVDENQRLRTERDDARRQLAQERQARRNQPSAPVQPAQQPTSSPQATPVTPSNIRITPAAPETTEAGPNTTDTPPLKPLPAINISVQPARNTSCAALGLRKEPLNTNERVLLQEKIPALRSGLEELLSRLVATHQGDPADANPRSRDNTADALQGWTGGAISDVGLLGPLPQLDFRNSYKPSDDILSGIPAEVRKEFSERTLAILRDATGVFSCLLAVEGNLNARPQQQ